MSIPFERSTVCPVLIGRAFYLDLLFRYLDNVHNSTGQTILITGEAGIGKTRLVREARHKATNLGLLTLQGNCFEPDRNFLYGPLLNLFRSFFGTRTSAEITQILGLNARELVKLLPELALQIPDLQPSPPLEPEQEKHRLFYTLDQFFSQLTSKQPLLVIIEDLHWCDSNSLEFLLQLVRRTTSQPMVLLLTCRIEEINPDLDHFLAALERERQVIEWSLKALTASDTDKMLQAIFDLKQATRPEFLLKIYGLTEGNPLFIEEVLRALIMEGEIFYEGSGWERKAIDELHIPRSVRDAVQRRCLQLSEAAKNLLALAAVAGRQFDFILLKDLTGKAESELIQLMKELISGQLVVEESAERFAFRHALTRQAIYLDLLTRERQALHNHIGDTIERLYATVLDGHLDELAYHFYEGKNWIKALVYLQKLGEKAQSLYAPRAAVEYLTRALEATKALGVTASPELYRARGLSYETCGEFELARDDLEAALQAARLTEDQMAEWQALRYLGMLWAGRDYDQTGQYYRQAYLLARQMNAPLILAHSLNRLGNWYLNVAKPEEALEYHSQALVLFKELGEQQGLAETLDLLGMTSCLKGNLVESRAYYEAAIILFTELNDRASLSASLGTLCFCCGSYQANLTIPVVLEPEKVISEVETALKIVQEIDQKATEAFCRLIFASYLGFHGDYSRALRELNISLQIAQDIGHQQWITATHFTLGALFFDLLDLPQAQYHLEQALAMSKATGSLHWEHCTVGYLVLVYIAQGNREKVELVLQPVLKTSLTPQTVGQKLVWFARAELARYSGEFTEALQFVEELVLEAANHSGDKTPAVPRLLLLKSILLISGLAGEQDKDKDKETKQAESILLAASRAAIRQGVKPLQWRIHLELGKLYQATARQDEAHQEFATAHTIIEQIAASLPPTQAALQTAYLQATAVLFPNSTLSQLRRGSKDQPAKFLTKRELDVLGLVAAGLSNAQVAEKLTISISTVNVHLNSIYGKLEVKSRTAATLYALEHKLF